MELVKNIQRNHISLTKGEALEMIEQLKKMVELSDGVAHINMVASGVVMFDTDTKQDRLTMRLAK